MGRASGWAIEGIRELQNIGGNVSRGLIEWDERKYAYNRVGACIALAGGEERNSRGSTRSCGIPSLRGIGGLPLRLLLQTVVKRVLRGGSCGGV